MSADDERVYLAPNFPVGIPGIQRDVTGPSYLPLRELKILLDDPDFGERYELARHLCRSDEETKHEGLAERVAAILGLPPTS